MCVILRNKNLRKAKVLGKKVFLFLVMIAWCLSCRAATLQQKFDVSIGIFDAAQMDLVYEETGKNFNIRSDVYTVHLFDTFYPFLGKYRSKGIIQSGKTIPELYQTYTKTRNHVRTKKIFYDKKGFAYKRISTKDENVREAAIDNVPASADAADLQSVFADLVSVLRQTGKCNLIREIYDGKKHYKVVFTDKGTEKRQFDYLKTTGDGRLCLMYVENLINNNDNILWDVSAEKPIKIWLMQDETTKIPYVMEIRIDSTPLGALKVVPTAVDIK